MTHNIKKLNYFAFQAIIIWKNFSIPTFIYLGFQNILKLSNYGTSIIKYFSIRLIMIPSFANIL